MALLDRSEWYDLARTTNWTPSFVTLEELFPADMSDAYGIAIEEWEKFDEPFKVSYREYVNIQREKDAGAYSVKSALARSDFYAQSDERWRSILKLHYGGVAGIEYGTASTQARMARFAKAPGNRNMSVFGSLDEVRHAQIQLFFAHELIAADPDYGHHFGWAAKALRTNDWVSVAVRHVFEDIEHTRDAVSTSVMTTFAFETAFTNLQFIALSADAAKYGDHVFSNLIQSIQTDEARHAQIGFSVLKIMLDNGKQAEAQKLVDIAFWLTWRQFSVLTGSSTDYYVPLDKREHSLKEFMHEWVIKQFLHQMKDLGLEEPWYWNILLEDIDTFHHGQHIGIWLTRPTVWWNPPAGVTPAEREWLEEKYPGWNDTFGQVWDVIIQNILDGKPEKTFLEAIPLLCEISNLAVTGIPGKKWDVKVFSTDYKGRRYLFGSEVDKWIFDLEPERYRSFRTVLDRYVDKDIQPQSGDGFLQYMGIYGEGGVEPHNYAWAEEYRDPARQTG